MRLAHTPNLTLLEHPQEFDLRRRRGITDFIEEDRPPVSDLKKPRLIGHCPRKCAPFVPEQFALEQRFRQRRAIDRHEQSPFA
jgi:hypothetical protein